MIAEGGIHQLSTPGKLILLLADEILTLLESGHGAELTEHVGGRVEALGQRGPVNLVLQRRHHPADPPTRHGPGFGEAVHHHDRIIFPGEGHEARSVSAIEHRTVVDLIRDDENPLAAGKFQQLLLLLVGHHPACRVAGRVHKDGFGFRTNGINDLSSTQLPAVFCESLTNIRNICAGNTEH